MPWNGFFHIIIIIEVKPNIINMANNTELLNQILKEVKELRELVDNFNNKNKKEYPKPLYVSSNKEFKTYPKDVKLLKQLISSTENQKSKEFILSILNNNYPSITQGQKDVIDSMKKDAGII